MIPKSNWKINAVLRPEEKLWREETLGMKRTQVRRYAENLRRTRGMSKTQRRRWLQTKQRRADIVARGSWFEELVKLFSPWGRK